ncbi:MAG TPA: alpha/beta fold hydrolase [Gemmatimonadaceae bacterium]|nr:alpha/beta fold hydrolase [Gemmatimonadaceae bacterium]
MPRLPRTPATPSDAASGVTAYDPRIAVTGQGRPLVYVPGMDGTGELFYRQIPLLAPSYRVATYALRDDAPDMARLIEDLAQVIARVAPDGEPAVLVGESFGGTLALSYALAHPGSVAAIVVLNSFPRFLPQHRLWLARRALRAMPWGAMRLVRRLTAFRLHSRHTHRAEVRRFLELTRRTTRAGYLGRLGILATYDVRHRLGELRVPALFLAADEDHLIPSVREARAMAAAVPGATVRILSGHGHSCLLAADVDLAELLREWGGIPSRGVRA